MNDDVNTKLLETSLEKICDDLSREHPIKGEMLRAVFQRMIAFIRLGDSDQLSLEEHTAKYEVLRSEIEELSSWLLDPKLSTISERMNRDIDSWTTAYVAGGGKQTAAFVQNTRNLWMRKPKGHPVEAEIRTAAISGLEMKQATPNLSWREIADKIWPAGRGVDSPEQCLRQQVIELRKVLQKFGLPGSAPFSRHPRKPEQVKSHKLL